MENSWREFCSDVANIDLSNPDESRYFRINQNLGRKPPNLDEVSELGNLKMATRRLLKQPENSQKIEKVAYKLIASLFYYERHGTPKPVSGAAWSCTGEIVFHVCSWQI